MNLTSDLLRDLSKRIALDPAMDKPAEIFAQVRPLLQKMGLVIMADRSKISIVEGQVNGSNSLYNVVLRRSSQITKDVIDHIKRNEDYLNVIQWSAQAIVVQVWYPFKAVEQKAAPGTPAQPTQPGVPPVPAGAPPAAPKA